ERRKAAGASARIGTSVTVHAAPAYASPCEISLGLARTASGAGWPQAIVLTMAQSANGAIASAPAMAACRIARASGFDHAVTGAAGVASSWRGRSLDRPAAQALRTASTQAQGAISGRSDAAIPAMSAAQRGRLTTSAAAVASA